MDALQKLSNLGKLATSINMSNKRKQEWVPQILNNKSINKITQIKEPVILCSNLNLILKTTRGSTMVIKDLHRDSNLIRLAPNPSPNWVSSLVMFKLIRNMKIRCTMLNISKAMPQVIALNRKNVEEAAHRNSNCSRWKSVCRFPNLRKRLLPETFNWSMSWQKV